MGAGTDADIRIGFGSMKARIAMGAGTIVNDHIFEARGAGASCPVK
jgi:hypothetical protein